MTEFEIAQIALRVMEKTLSILSYKECVDIVRKAHGTDKINFDDLSEFGKKCLMGGASAKELEEYFKKKNGDLKLVSSTILAKGLKELKESIDQMANAVEKCMEHPTHITSGEIEAIKAISHSEGYSTGFEDGEKRQEMACDNHCYNHATYDEERQKGYDEGFTNAKALYELNGKEYKIEKNLFCFGGKNV